MLAKLLICSFQPGRVRIQDTHISGFFWCLVLTDHGFTPPISSLEYVTLHNHSTYSLCHQADQINHLVTQFLSLLLPHASTRLWDSLYAGQLHVFLSASFVSPHLFSWVLKIQLAIKWKTFLRFFQGCGDHQLRWSLVWWVNVPFLCNLTHALPHHTLFACSVHSAPACSCSPEATFGSLQGVCSCACPGLCRRVRTASSQGSNAFHSRVLSASLITNFEVLLILPAMWSLAPDHVCWRNSP